MGNSANLPGTQIIGGPVTELHAATVGAVVDYMVMKQRELERAGASADAKLAAYAEALNEFVSARAAHTTWIENPCTPDLYGLQLD